MEKENPYEAPATASNNNSNDNTQEAAISSFMGGILEQLTRFNDNFEKFVKVLEENNVVTAQSVQKIEKTVAGGVAISAISAFLSNFAQKTAKNAAQGAAQKKEASSSSPLSPSLKDEKERTKEKEEINPSLIFSSSSEENCELNAQKFVQNGSAVQISQEVAVKKEMNALEDSFQKFWDAYGFKRDRKRAWEVWKEMPRKDREAAMAGVRRYKWDCSCREIKMAYAKNYLTDRRWEDEFDTEPEY